MTPQQFKEIRKRLGLSTVALGRALGYRGQGHSIASTIRRFEANNMRPIPAAVARLMLMFEQFGVPPDWTGRP